MDVCTDVAVEFARAQIAAGADVIGVGDSICSQIPPDSYAKLVAPRQQRLFEAIHAAGNHTRLHICGDVTHLLPYLKDLSVDVLDIDHLVDIEMVRNTVGGEVVLAGNLDPVTDLLHGTPDDIRRKVLDIYERVGNPMVVTAGCEIPRDTPRENLQALCEPVALR
jgi:MtaA/CmuA family methyltransferase